METSGDHIAEVVVCQRIVRSVAYEKIDTEGIDERKVHKKKIVGSVDFVRRVKAVELI